VQEWTDERLTWDPEQFGNLTNIIVKADRLWLPELAVMNGCVCKCGYSFVYCHFSDAL